MNIIDNNNNSAVISFIKIMDKDNQTVSCRAIQHYTVEQKEPVYTGIQQNNKHTLILT